MKMTMTMMTMRRRSEEVDLVEQLLVNSRGTKVIRPEHKMVHCFRGFFLCSL
jgi:hypothetical protein